MIYSMTGFGRGEAGDDEHKISVEIKSVNHRYLDFNIKMPKRFNHLDTFVRSILKEYASRGKIDVFISYEDNSENAALLKYNRSLARQYYQYAGIISQDFGMENDMTVARLMRFPDIFRAQEGSLDEELLKSLLDQALREACVQLKAARNREGEALKSDIIGKLDHMRENVLEIEHREPAILNNYKARIMGKVKDLLGDTPVDESRIAAEVVIFADKICTDEETVRLRSHIDNMVKELARGGLIGRKLDFLTQEMNREANTILSKSNDMITSNMAIDLKTEIEKVREQIQNIE
ncbi:MAG: YicC/YloC family endoribonuclease [Bilifractor sp.]|jgi:uncharacterized protein (TIGR00255 family)